MLHPSFFCYLAIAVKAAFVVRVGVEVGVVCRYTQLGFTDVVGYVDYIIEDITVVDGSFVDVAFHLSTWICCGC